MCDKCRELIACPNGEKRAVTLFEAEVGDEWAKTTMVVDRDSVGVADAFIATQTLMAARYANVPFEINHCPFCGEKLRG